MNFQTIARALDPELYDLIQPYRVTDEALMPEEYRRPSGRFLHDDQPWPFNKNPRINTAYRVPLPFKIIEGPYTLEPMLFDPAYPLSPGAEVTYDAAGLMYVNTMRAGYGLIKYTAFINGEWRHVFTKYTGIWFGKRLSWYKGLHQDNHVSPPHVTADGKIRSDLMCWFPELACSWVTEI